MPEIAFKLHDKNIEKNFVKKLLLKDVNPNILCFLYFFNNTCYPKELFKLIASYFILIERWDAIGVSL